MIYSQIGEIAWNIHNTDDNDGDAIEFDFIEWVNDVIGFDCSE